MTLLAHAATSPLMFLLSDGTCPVHCLSPVVLLRFGDACLGESTCTERSVLVFASLQSQEVLRLLGKLSRKLVIACGHAKWPQQASTQALCLTFGDTAALLMGCSLAVPEAFHQLQGADRFFFDCFGLRAIKPEFEARSYLSCHGFHNCLSLSGFGEAATSANGNTRRHLHTSA